MSDKPVAPEFYAIIAGVAANSGCSPSLRVPRRWFRKGPEKKQEELYPTPKDPTPKVTYPKIKGKDRNSHCKCGSGIKAKKCQCHFKEKTNESQTPAPEQS